MGKNITRQMRSGGYFWAGYTYAATWQTGKFINPNTGVLMDNTAPEL
ncbi:hypothetical protein LNP26_27195 [Klebsiella variicola subsp. variicola]|nr:hypothetical protein [Klebsiella variicola subsp. variicola]